MGRATLVFHRTDRKLPKKATNVEKIQRRLERNEDLARQFFEFTPEESVELIRLLRGRDPQPIVSIMRIFKKYSHTFTVEDFREVHDAHTVKKVLGE